MRIAPELILEYPHLNDAQRQIVEHGDGPLLVIAGPGSGKTFSLVLRAMNLLLLGETTARELLICTFTEKAAFELRDRIGAVARKVRYKGDLSELRVGTIHGFCNRLLIEQRHRTPLGHNFETLDDLTQLLFIFENFAQIVGAEHDGAYLGRWTTKWTAIEGVRDYFNRITEELVNPGDLQRTGNEFLGHLAGGYLAYQRAMWEKNRVDFAHLQKLVWDLLQDRQIAESVTRDIRYVLVDEYQDTNYIQEQLLIKLRADEKSLRGRRRGSESLSFPRSHRSQHSGIPSALPQLQGGSADDELSFSREIIRGYDRWMASADWSNPDGRPFRFEKTIVPDSDGNHPDYPALFTIWGQSANDEGKRLADLVGFLKKSEVIADYSQVALLLHSVRLEHSDHYLSALEAKGIPVFCPRARAYFDNEEVRLMVACFAIIFGWHGGNRGQVAGAVRDLSIYVDAAIVELGRRVSSEQPLALELRKFVRQIVDLRERQALDLRPADYFYRLLALEPFTSLVKNENRARNLAVFSQLLNIFQSYYHYTVVTHKNREYLRFHLFNSFLRLLHEGGINEYEDPDQPFPKGHVQMMTIHQAKGLEFPVVIVGSLDKQLATAKKVDQDLQPFYHRVPFEPPGRITLFDRMRLHYVAFSRPEKLLVLTSHAEPKPHFATIWQGLQQWPYVQKQLLAAQTFALKERIPVKRSYSFTGDLKLYETCPRQYQFFREYDFTPSRSAVIFFGLLVHQTIEEIHRVVLDGAASTLDESRIRQMFDRTFHFLTLADVRAIGETAREAAFVQVMNYFNQNQEEMARVIETEVDVSVEKDGYILTGKVDLLMGGDGRLELLDFKTSPRPADSPELLASYERQLCTYAHILEQRRGKRPERLLLYWTSEPAKREAVMAFPYRPDLIDDAGRWFDRVVGKIQSKDFAIIVPPERGICKECDLRSFCAQDGTIVLRDVEG
jgi:DNA helicase-2/ATP-dependent DNA helicase PcrA